MAAMPMASPPARLAVWIDAVWIDAVWFVMAPAWAPNGLDERSIDAERCRTNPRGAPGPRLARTGTATRAYRDRDSRAPRARLADTQGATRGWGGYVVPQVKPVRERYASPGRRTADG